MRLAHTALYVENLEAMRSFYEANFGAVAGEKYHNPRTGLSTYFLRFDGECALELMHRPDICGRGGLGYAHIALSTGSREAVDKLTCTLEAAGVRRLSGPRMTGDGYYESCLLDPEGNVIELTE